MKQTFRIVLAGKSDQVFILVREESADDDGVITSKAGFIEAEPAKANDLLAKFISGERKCVLGAQRADGNYDVKVLPKGMTTLAVGDAAAPAGELKH